MGRRIGLMEHTKFCLTVGISYIETIRLDMAGSWIHLIGEVMDTGFILVMVLTVP